jgi:alkanesulfonate monooxygenase SsuD/methylene tetrahydromethanopterin reductase-like flavin-dependent oxidoreductase (luciferase family)
VELGLNLGYWGAGNDADNLALAQEADDLGFAVAWVAEAYGSDAPTVLAFVAAQTSRSTSARPSSRSRSQPGQLRDDRRDARTPCPAGASGWASGSPGPQVSEGWHGVRFDKPLARTREYSDIVKLALSRQKVRYDGQHYVLPLPDGPGKALQLTVRPVREHIPMYLAAVGPKNLELAGELFDGWLAIFYSPTSPRAARPHRGRAGEGGRRWTASTSCPRCRSWWAPTASLRRSGPRLRRALRGRHGQPGQELLQPAGRADGLRRRGGRGPGPLPGTAVRGCGGGRALRVPGRHGAAGTQGAHRREDAGAGVLRRDDPDADPFAGSLDERRAVLRTAVEALELSGVGS